jgi:hypothetical protein
LPLPDYNFDPTEASTPWLRCVEQDWKLVVSTEDGKVAQADEIKLKGPLPGKLSTGASAKSAYQQLVNDPLD